MPDALLPEEFSHLLPFVEQWDLPDITTRYKRRLGSSMEDMQAFNDAIVACAEDVKAYLDAKSFDDYTDADRRLARLMFSFAIVAQSVEIYKQPNVPDGGSRMFEVVVEPSL